MNLIQRDSRWIFHYNIITDVDVLLYKTDFNDKSFSFHFISSEHLEKSFLHLVCQCRGPSIFSPRYSFSSSMIFAIKYFSEKAYVTLSLSYSFSSLHMLSFVCFSFCLLTSFYVSLSLLLSFWYLLSPVSLLLISTVYLLTSHFLFIVSIFLQSPFPILECSRCRVLTVLNLAPFTTLSFSGSPSLRSYFPPNLNR